ncbi:hypothetical protein EDC14_1006119 [Hydrogenispora ethanolica]|uniref:Uncharacterized protein n=1 Tax=Hydrogenispora ethanolica TaxID=1082276 RepID=A0A4R1S0G8_HYDET|nr:hypothetical protein EDC14_1006119 [Hydrogenispora ethanolica]
MAAPAAERARGARPGGRGAAREGTGARCRAAPAGAGAEVARKRGRVSQGQAATAPCSAPAARGPALPAPGRGNFAPAGREICRFFRSDGPESLKIIDRRKKILGPRCRINIPLRIKVRPVSARRGRPVKNFPKVAAEKNGQALFSAARGGV